MRLLVKCVNLALDQQRAADQFAACRPCKLALCELLVSLKDTCFGILRMVRRAG